MTANKLEAIIKWGSVGLGLVAAVIFVIWAFANTEPGAMPWGPLVIVVVGLIAVGVLIGRTALFFIQPFRERSPAAGRVQTRRKGTD
ncbi:MAG: hypothetical protein ACLFO1_10495 [Spirochaetaceae bacterium]